MPALFFCAVVSRRVITPVGEPEILTSPPATSDTPNLDRQVAQFVQAMAVFAISDGGSVRGVELSANDIPLLAVGQVGG